jgi:hypothetical protein
MRILRKIGDNGGIVRIQVLEERDTDWIQAVRRPAALARIRSPRP